MIQTAFLGDVVLSTPLLTALAQRHGRVDVITTPAAAPLLEGHPAVGDVIRYDKRGKDHGWTGLVQLAQSLRTREYTRAYLPHRSWRSGVLAWLAHIPERIGFTDGARLFYTTAVSRAHRGHEVERLLALAGVEAGDALPVTLPRSQEDEAAAVRWMADHDIADGFIALAPGSIWGTKRWPYYGDLAARLEGDIVIVGGPDDRSLGDDICQTAGRHARNAAGALTLRASAALLARASMLITNDSAPLHLATAAGTPIVAIFGPTVPGFGFGPRGAGDMVVQRDELSCRPCSRHGPQRCPLGHHRCMRDVSVETVLVAIEKTKNENVTRAAAE
ncbi:MAG: lipopolysaccharide heptosyltransferase II [Gemmatimonadota bacterium]